MIFSRRSRNTISPAQSGSPWAFCHGAVGIVASDQRVSTLWVVIFESAKEIAFSTSMRPSVGFGISASILFAGSATTSLINEPTSGLASAVGTGVTNPIHKLDNPGVNTGTRIIQRFFSPDSFANFCIMSA